MTLRWYQQPHRRCHGHVAVEGGWGKGRSMVNDCTIVERVASDMQVITLFNQYVLL